MTTSYSLKVADARFGGFVRLLFRWRASFYKLLYKELLVYLALYFVLSATYRIVLNDRQREYFEDISLFCNKHTDLIPVAFLLGFYVSVVFTRWWQQYTCIPWPDRIAALIGCSVHGEDHRGRLIRRTLVRYVNLATLLIMRSISTAVYKRFPTMNHVVEAGFMMPSELKDYDQLDSPHNKFWLPLNWFCNLVTKCRKEGRVEDPYTFRALIEESNNIRGSLAMLYSYDWISVPLVYTQVVTVAVYTFFVSCLMGRQWLDPGKGYTGHEVDLYFPIFTVLQFLFYMGWLKVAEQLINPFGQDDDDFETNWCIDRNLQISYLAVDDLYMTTPTLERDIYWNQPDPELPYTEASISNRNMTEPFLGSTFDMRLNVQNMEFTNLHTVAEEPEEKQESSEGLENAPGPTIVVSDGEDSVLHSTSAPSSPRPSNDTSKSRVRASPRSLRKALLTSKTRAKMESPLKMKTLDNKKRPLSWGGRCKEESSVVNETENNIAGITTPQGNETNRLEVPSSQRWVEENSWTEDEAKPLLQPTTPSNPRAEAGLWVASTDTGIAVRGHLHTQDGGSHKTEPYTPNRKESSRESNHVLHVDNEELDTVQRLTVV